MSRFSPTVLPRANNALADALSAFATNFAAGARANRDRKDRLAAREEDRADARQRSADELAIRNRELDYRSQHDSDQMGATRAGLADNGIFYDPKHQVGALDQTLDLSGALPGAMPMRLQGRDTAVRDVGDFTYDPSATPQGRTATEARGRTNALASELERAGAPRFLAYDPTGLDTYVKGQQPTPTDWQKQGYPSFEAWRADQLRRSGIDPKSGQRLRGAGGSGSGADGDGPDGESVLDASREVTEYDRGTGQVLDLARQLSPSDPTDRQMMLRGGGADSAAVVRADSLRGVAGQRLAQRPTIADVRARSAPPPRPVALPPLSVTTGARATPASAPAAAAGGKPAASKADRWEELRKANPKRSPAEITAQVNREFGA